MTNIIEDAIEALRPFMMAAEAYTSFDGQHDFPDGYTFDIGAFQRVTVGDLRRAAATLARLEQAKENAQPVAWMYGADREEPHASIKRWPKDIVERQCWTETPLYAAQ
ncbi:hypothetical protein [Rhizorhapis sp.]|uniref:hypothetical protein n=1 Tax=Rhizorhapis sp. TaxID=1968842 RepID=UPI002B494237|nr:hypothetical protein [Rhizorhapis sp.]HKR17672.1 hypothetical protein [Rhizorhapis sp.]